MTAETYPAECNVELRTLERIEARTLQLLRWAQYIALDTDAEMCQDCGHVAGTHSQESGCLVEQWREYCPCGQAFIDGTWQKASGQSDE